MGKGGVGVYVAGVGGVDVGGGAVVTGIYGGNADMGVGELGKDIVDAGSGGTSLDGVGVRSVGEDNVDMVGAVVGFVEHTKCI